VVFDSKRLTPIVIENQGLRDDLAVLVVKELPKMDWGGYIFRPRRLGTRLAAPITAHY